VLASIMDALEAVHREWGPHLDLRPELIRFDESGACHIEMEGREAAQTRVLGRHPYRAPEQAIRPEHMGVVSDVYALGVIAIEALSGRQPFRGGSDDDTWLRKVNHALPRLAELLPDDDWAWSEAARSADDALWSLTEPEPERRTPDIAAARELLAARGVISAEAAQPRSEALEQHLADISARVAAADRLEAELAAERARAEARSDDRQGAAARGGAARPFGRSAGDRGLHRRGRGAHRGAGTGARRAEGARPVARADAW
jgi:serine/threonine-protein kinase